MFAALAPLFIFMGIDGVVHGVARSVSHLGKKSVSLFLARSLALFSSPSSVVRAPSHRLDRAE